MAIYHFSVKMIGRSAGSNAVAAAAYRSASRLHDERVDRTHDFTDKAGVVHSEIMAPEAAPKAWSDRQTLWNAVEAAELGRNAQLAREIEFALPRELEQTEVVLLAREFVRREFVERGTVADLNIHWDKSADGEPKPHAHVMLTMRVITSSGFGLKVRDWWNRKALLRHWREAWAGHVNQRLAQLDLETTVDHRSYREQGIGLEPQNKIGPAGARRLERAQTADRAIEHRRIARRNGEQIIRDPKVALQAMTHGQATFTGHDLARFIHRHSDDKDQFDRVLSAVKTSVELVTLGHDGLGRERFTSREMLAVEQKLERSATTLAERRDHDVGRSARGEALARADARGLVLAGEQRDAFETVTGRERLSLVIGHAGSGKSSVLGVAREAWQAAGYQVRGAALSGIAAENLESGSSIPSRTLASLEHSWAQGRDGLTSRDVLVIDEAGLVGSRQLQRIVSTAEQAGAKVVMVGDPEQLQSIEAGAAFRALTEQHGAVEITDIRRQHDAWQRRATRQLATGRVEEAISAYAVAGMVKDHESRQAAREALVEGWLAERTRAPKASQLMLAYTRNDVTGLNALARERLDAAGELGANQTLQTTRGARDFAVGDRVMFLRNERSLGVKNGSVGIVQQLGAGAMDVMLDDGRSVALDLKRYVDLDHGYATTIHKSQGVTVDRVHLLVSAHMDRQAAYVALSRHRQGVAVHYSRGEFATPAYLAQSLARDRPKTMASDYADAFAERRQISTRAKIEKVVERTADWSSPEPATTKYVRPERQPEVQHERAAHRAIRAFAAAAMEARRMRLADRPLLDRQRIAITHADRQIAALWPGADKALTTALDRAPELLAGAAEGRTGPVLAAMRLERGALIQDRTDGGRLEPDHSRKHDLNRDRER